MKLKTPGRCDTKDLVAANTNPPPAGDLLETVKHLRAMAGDALDDEEFSFFVLEKNLAPEAGFQFLCFHDGCLSLSVPRQDEESWRPAAQWISPEKEKIAGLLAKKIGLMLTEPPDAALRWIMPSGMAVRHHLELSNRRETIIIAHPEFLKIRLYASESGWILPPIPGLLKDLSALYETVILPGLAATLQKESL